MKQLSWFSLPLVLVAAAVPAALHAQTITFAKPVQISVGADPTTYQMPYDPVAGDFNGDGNADFLVKLIGTNSFGYDNTSIPDLKVLLGNGTGGFSVYNFGNAPEFFDQYLVADVNGDGKDDILTLQGNCNPDQDRDCGAYPETGFSVFLSDGNGHFTAGYTSALPEGSASGVVGDFNKDGKKDVAVLISPFDTEGLEPPILIIFLNQGNGSFLPSPSMSLADLTNGGAGSLVTGDFSGDGNLDLALLSSINTTNPHGLIYTLAGNGKGGFGQPQLMYSFDSPAESMVAADLTGSPKTDLVVVLDAKNAPGANPRIATLIPKFGGGFYWGSAISTPPNTTPLDISLSDLNGDGKLDLIGTGYDATIGKGIVRIYPGLGNGKFGTPALSLPPIGDLDLQLAAAPLKRGELPSLMIALKTPTLELLVNTTKKP